MKSKSRKLTKAELEFILLVKTLPCCICKPISNWGEYALIKTNTSEAHHLTHCGRRIGHIYLLPLCVAHHRGDIGISGYKCEWDTSFINQFRMCKQMHDYLGLEMPMPVSKVVDYKRLLAP